MRKGVATMLAIVLCVQMSAIGQIDSSVGMEFVEFQQKLFLMQRFTLSRSGKSAADELQLTKNQLIKLAGLREETSIFSRELLAIKDQKERQNSEVEFVQTAEERVRTILNDGQLRRLSELELQSMGAKGLSRPATARKLGITTGQQLRISDARQDLAQQPAEEFGHACYEILSDDQRVMWNEMIGLPSSAVTSSSPICPPKNPLPPKRSAAPRVPSPSYQFLTNPVIKVELMIAEEHMAKLAELDAKIQEATMEWRESLAASHSTDQNAIQNQLKLSAKITQANRDFQAAFLEKMSEPKLKRLREIEFQRSGDRAILSREFRESAKLTDEQIDVIDHFLRVRNAKGLPDVRPSTRSRDGVSYSQETIKEALKMMTVEQRDIWYGMTGKPVPLEGLYDTMPSTRR